jgi:ankyrin repeat protein
MIPIPEVCDIIRSGKNDQLQVLLDETPALAGQKTDQGISILAYACYCRNARAVEILREKKKNLDVFEAACVGDLSVLKSELSGQAGALNAYSADGFTLLGLSCFFGHAEVAEFLVQKGADVNRASNNSFKVAPIHSACSISNYTITDMLLRHGADPNTKQQAGVTPLHEAAHNGRTDLVQLLIDYGADVNVKTDGGQTPLAMAKEKSFVETAALLQKHGGK